VIFTSVLGDDEAGYAEVAEQWERTAAAHPGYLGFEPARSGLGISVSYWASPEDARSWKQVSGHLVAQRIERQRRDRAYRVRVADMDRECGSEHPS